jgi:membrane-bound ClpP family serine protease
VRTALDPHGQVYVHGELWQAHAVDNTSLAAGTEVRIVAIDGLAATVQAVSATQRVPVQQRPPADSAPVAGNAG